METIVVPASVAVVVAVAAFAVVPPAVDAAAVAAIGEKASEKGASTLQTCNLLFKDFQFGLKLIQKNTGRREFNLTADTIENPDAFLSDIVVRSYRDVESGAASDQSDQ